MDGIGFRPLRNLENQSKPCSHHSLSHQNRENCSESNSHFGDLEGGINVGWSGRVNAPAKSQCQAVKRKCGNEMLHV